MRRSNRRESTLQEVKRGEDRLVLFEEIFLDFQKFPAAGGQRNEA
jgi:hypothetical protein